MRRRSSPSACGFAPRRDRDSEGIPVNHPIDHDPDDASIYRHVHAQAVHCLTCISPLPFAPRANPVDKLLLRFPSSLTERALTAVRPNAPLRYGPGQFDRLLGDLADEHSHYSGARGPGLMCTVAVIPAAEVLEGCPLSAWKRLCACARDSPLLDRAGHWLVRSSPRRCCAVPGAHLSGAARP